MSLVATLALLADTPSAEFATIPGSIYTIEASALCVVEIKNAAGAWIPHYQPMPLTPSSEAADRAGSFVAPTLFARVVSFGLPVTGNVYSGAAAGLTDAQLRENPVPVIGKSLSVVVNPVVDTSVYGAGDCVGGKLTLAGVPMSAGGYALLHHIHILDRSNSKPAGRILVFGSDPTAATITNNATFVYSTDDLKQIASIPIASSDYGTVGGKASADLANLGRMVKAASGTTLYAVFVTDGAPNFAASTDLQIIFNFLPN